MSGGRSNQLTQEAPANVLVVDDESTVRGLVARWLCAEGYACAQAANADAALEHLRTSDVHLVTSDITLPGRSGIELLREIRRTYGDTAVIMMTGVGQAKSAIEAFTHGASGYLVKPVECEELLFQVRSALERRLRLPVSSGSLRRNRAKRLWSRGHVWRRVGVRPRPF